MVTNFGEKKVVTKLTSGKVEYKVELERWAEVDEFGKARTRIVVRADSFAEAKAEMDKAVAGTEVATKSASISQNETQRAVAKKTYQAKTYGKGGHKKPYKKFKNGRTLNEELGDEEPEVCPDCGSAMAAKIVTLKSGQQKRVLSCPTDGNTWWDNRKKSVAVEPEEEEGNDLTDEVEELIEEE